MDMSSIKDIKVRVDAVKVVAVTCLGITSPLLANKRYDVCIMDESGQTTLPVCTPNSVIVCIYRSGVIGFLFAIFLLCYC